MVSRDSPQFSTLTVQTSSLRDDVALMRQLLGRIVVSLLSLIRWWVRYQIRNLTPINLTSSVRLPTIRCPWVVQAPSRTLFSVLRHLWLWVWMVGFRLPSFGIKRLYADKVLFAVIVFATIFSVVSLVYFMSRDEVLSYVDGMSHLMISKRVLESPTPGGGQLGGTWPPLPHILTLPLVWSDTLYYSGLAGSIVSMICFVATCGYLYKTSELLTGSRGAGIVTAAVFVLSAEVLYMQSTPMTELPLFLFLIAGIYYLIKWGEDVEKWWYLLAIAACFLAATLTRYESWVLLFGALGWVLFVGWKEKFGWEKNLAFFFYLFPLATVGIFGWMGWNAYILDDPLYFYRGEYSDPSLWIEAHDKTIGSWSISLRTYWIATYENVGWAPLLLSFGGLALFIIQSRCWRILLLQPSRVQNKSAALLLLAPFPFFVYALQSGQRPLHVEQVMQNLYNVRFGLIMILPVALFVGYLTARKVALQLVTLGVLVASFIVPEWRGELITRSDPVENRQDAQVVAQVESASWLRENYDQGTVLMESFGNEIQYFESRIPTDAILFEGAYRKWELALDNPSQYVDWIIMRHDSEGGDKVWRALSGTSDLNANYGLVFENDTVQIYKRKVKQVDLRPPSFQSSEVPAKPELKVERVAIPTEPVFHLYSVSEEKTRTFEPRLYTVQEGDNLSELALKFLSDGDKWVDLYEVNQNLIGEDPNLILPGQVLRIPSA